MGWIVSLLNAHGLQLPNYDPQTKSITITLTLLKFLNAPQPDILNQKLWK